MLRSSRWLMNRPLGVMSSLELLGLHPPALLQRTTRSRSTSSTVPLREVETFLAGLSSGDLKRAYIQAAKASHPDANMSTVPAEVAASRFVDVQSAFQHVKELAAAARRRRAGGSSVAGDTEGGDASLEYLQDVPMHLSRLVERYKEAISTSGEQEVSLKEDVEVGHVSDSLERVLGICRDEKLRGGVLGEFCTSFGKEVTGASLLTVACRPQSPLNLTRVEKLVQRLRRFAPRMVSRVRRHRHRALLRFRKAQGDRAQRSGLAGMRSHGLGITSLNSAASARYAVPRTIEECSLKPLVLLGTLCLTDAPSVASSEATKHDGLRCTIHHDDTDDEIVTKVGDFEQRSFAAMQLMLAAMGALDVLSAQMGLTAEGRTAFAMSQAFAERRGEAEKQLWTIQRLAIAALAPPPGMPVHMSNAPDVARPAVSTGESIVDGPFTMSSVVESLSLLFDDRHSTLVTSAADIVQPAEEEPLSADERDGEGVDAIVASSWDSAEVGWSVVRSPAACEVHDLRLNVTVTADKEMDVFLRRFYSAMAEVAKRITDYQENITEAARLKREVETEEFLPIDTNKVLPVRDGIGDDADASAPLERHRPPVKTFSRVFGLGTGAERQFWAHVHRNRVYIASVQDSIGHFNLRFRETKRRCSDDAAAESDPFADDEIGAVFNMCGSDGADVELDASILADEAAFDDWLKDAVRLAGEAREAQRLLSENGIDFIHPAPDLPPSDFLTFVTNFVGSAARATLEGLLRRSHGSDHGGDEDHRGTDPRVVVSTSFGIDHGDLHVPFFLDPLALVALLGERDFIRQLESAP